MDGEWNVNLEESETRDADGIRRRKSQQSLKSWLHSSSDTKTAGEGSWLGLTGVGWDQLTTAAGHITAP